MNSLPEASGEEGKEHVFVSMEGKIMKVSGDMINTVIDEREDLIVCIHVFSLFGGIVEYVK